MNEWADVTLYTTDDAVCGQLMNLSPYAVGRGFPYSMMLSSISSTNIVKRDDADSWSGKGVINGFGTSEIKALDADGFTLKIVDGTNKPQDEFDFSGAQCKLISQGRGLSCRAPGVGSVTLKPFTSTTWTMAKNNKVNDVKTKSSSSSHDGKGSTEDKISYHKLSFKFYKREFVAALESDDPLGPLTVVMDKLPASFGAGLELVSLLSSCKGSFPASGTEKISCKPFDPEA